MPGFCGGVAAAASLKYRFGTHAPAWGSLSQTSMLMWAVCWISVVLVWCV